VTDFIFDDFARTTLGGAQNSATKTPLSAQQVADVIAYLKSPGSGPDAATSYAEYVASKLSSHPPELPPGVDYVGFSGADSSGKSNFQQAVQYGKELGGRAGIIGDTPWGQFVQDLDVNAASYPEFQAMQDGLQDFMKAQGTEPRGKNHAGALLDMMWNAGSPPYFENAIATGKPLLALVENAPPNRGFSNFELATALEHPNVRINGYPISAFGSDPLAFASKSAAEYQALERSLAEAASINSGQPVTVAEVRLHLKPIDGYDAVDQVLFDRPVHEFKSLNLTEMAATRADWHAARASLGTSPRLHAEAPEHAPHAATPPGGARAPPGGTAGIAEVATESAPHGVQAGMSPGMKVAGVAGVALLAHDFATSGHKWVELYSHGNAAGADSTASHFVGRNVGGGLGGFVAGAGVGLATGSWTGPGAIAAGIGGGVLGAYMGERWADQRDIDHIYTQKDTMGREWTRSPTDPDARWLRASDQQQVQSGDLGTGVEVRPVQTALGEDVTVRTHYVATGTLERQLDWKAAKASYELGLTNPPPAQDPYRLRARDDQGPAPGAFETGRAFVRDPASREWELEIKQIVDGHVPITRTAPVSPEQSLQLDEQSRAVIAQNAANTPAAMAARYMVAYEQGRWSDFGDAKDPSIPLAIQNARDSADTLRASDGNRYTRDEEGQWVSKGLVLDSAANRNVSEELEVTWQSQQAGVAGLNVMAEEIRANVHLAPEGIRGQVDALYQQHGIVRTEEQLAATAAAVEQSLASNGRQGDLVLELMPDPRTHAPSPESAIAAFGDAGGRMVLTATTTMEDVAKIQSLHQQPSATAAVPNGAHVSTLDTVTVSASGQVRRPEQMPVQEAPELRIDALSPQERDAHQQALHEVNRQGVSAVEAEQVAAIAATQAGGGRVDETRLPQLPADAPQPPMPGQAAGAAVPQAAAAAAVTPAFTEREEQPKPVQPTETPRQAAQEDAARAEEARVREDAARADERMELGRQEHRGVQGSEHPVPQTPTAPMEPVHAKPAVPPTVGAPALTATSSAESQTNRDVAHFQNEPVERPRETISPSPEQPSEHLVTAATGQQSRGEGEQPSGAPTAAPLSVEPSEQPVPASERDHSLQAARAVGSQPLQEAAVEQPTQPREAPPVAAEPWTPENPNHPDHRLYQEIRKEVTALDASHGRTYDQTSERLTGSLLVLAKGNGLDHVDHVVLSRATANQPGGQNVFVVQGELNDPGHLRAGMSTQQAVTAPFEQSMAQFDVVAREQAQAQQLTDQREMVDRQQESQRSSMRMG
jgi:hypothetical protein